MLSEIREVKGRKGAASHAAYATAGKALGVVNGWLNCKNVKL